MKVDMSTGAKIQAVSALELLRWTADNYGALKSLSNPDELCHPLAATINVPIKIEMPISKEDRTRIADPNAPGPIQNIQACLDELHIPHRFFEESQGKGALKDGALLGISKRAFITIAPQDFQKIIDMTREKLDDIRSRYKHASIEYHYKRRNPENDYKTLPTPEINGWNVITLMGADRLEQLCAKLIAPENPAPELKRLRQRWDVGAPTITQTGHRSGRG